MGKCLIQAIGAEALKSVAPLFANWDETLIWTALQGRMGMIWTYGSAALCACGDFVFLSPAQEDAKELLQAVHSWLGNRFAILTVREENVHAAVPAVFAQAAREETRYAFWKDSSAFDRKLLEELTKKLPSEMMLRVFDSELYALAMQESWSRDFCSQFSSCEDFLQNGVAVGTLQDGRLIGGAGTYIAYEGGIEVEVDTHEDFRGQGIATACSARLILECMDRGLYPSWDAANLISVRLAQKLGYRLKGPYAVWHINE